MRLNEAELRRVKRRIGIVAPSFWGLPLTIFPLIYLLTWALSKGVDNRGNPLTTSVYVSVGITIAFAVGVLFYFMPGLSRQYLGLLRDLRTSAKETVLAPITRKQRQVWNNHASSYYLRFDFGRVEVGQKLYDSVREGQLLTLVLSKHGRELLSVSEVEMKPMAN
jgi:hypothetical protein